MKRQSKAEEALNKQIKNLDIKLDMIQNSIEALSNQASAVRDIKKQLEREVDNLKHIRLTASERLSKG
jgi:prefoldin subunit 5